MCFVQFNLIFSFSFSFFDIFLQLFHLISSRTNTNSSHLDGVPLSVFNSFCLSACYSGKATLRAPLQGESSCCCLRQHTAAICACQDFQFVGLTPAHTHNVSSLFMLPYNLLHASGLVAKSFFLFFFL